MCLLVSELREGFSTPEYYSWPVLGEVTQKSNILKSGFGFLKLGKSDLFLCQKKSVLLLLHINQFI